MLSIVVLLLSHVAALAAPVRTLPLELANNKPFVQVQVDDSAPQWFVLDTGNNGASILAQELVDRLKLGRTAGEKADIGAGQGADVRLSQVNRVVTLRALGETLSVAQPPVLTLGHVARMEGRSVDGLLGTDFMSRHVVTLDYAARTIAVADPAGYAPPAGAVVVPIDLETGWPVAECTITPRGGTPLRARVIVDTGVRGVGTMFRPFSAKHRLYGLPGTLQKIVLGAGAGGVTRGDVGRLESFTLGSLTFAEPVMGFSRDTTGIFSLDVLDGIIGGELLKRHRVTFDYAHGRMILEPYAGKPETFEHDMSGLFMVAEDPDYRTLRIRAVNPNTPAAEAGLLEGDEVVSIDGKRLNLDRARLALRAPGARKLEIRRDGVGSPGTELEFAL